MINYITCATALLALVKLNSVTAIYSKNDSERQHGLRNLYSSEGHEITDVQTKCEQVIEGDPLQCIIICIEVTSIKKGDEHIDEYSKVNQRECEAGWKHDGHSGDVVDWEGHTEWTTYSPAQFPTSHPTEEADYGHDIDSRWTGDGYDRIIDWTDDGWTSRTDEILLSGGSKGSKSGGYSKRSKGEYSNRSKSKSGNSKSGKGSGQSKSSKVYYFDNVKEGVGSGYGKSSKSSGVGDAVNWYATILEPIHDEWEAEASSWSIGAGIVQGNRVSSSSKSSKLESVGWSSGAGTIKKGNGSGSNKSFKLAADSDEWKSAKSSGGGKGSGSSKSSKPAGGYADVLDGKRSISDGSSGSWSGGAAL
jgi:hypothetical protein